MEIPEELYYTEEHEWMSYEEAEGIATIGITDYAQGELGDIVYVELREGGEHVKRKEPFGTIEAVKSVEELFAPVSGEIVEVNTELENHPELVNADPYGDGWMIKIKVENPEEIDSLLGAADYRKHIS